VPEFVDSAVKEIDDRLRALKDEASRLEAARAALIGARGGRGRAAGGGRARTQRTPASRRNGRSSATQSRRGGNTRADEALELVRKQPGITIPEIAAAMSIKPNYLYRVLPQLASRGEVKRDGQGWHPGSSSTPAGSTRARTGSTRRRTRTARSGASARTRAARTGTSASATRSAKSQPNASATRPARTRRSNGSAPAGGRTARGATKASVLAALKGGEAMTAGEVAAKAGLARPTVSTTLSKLARSGEVQKAARGYQLAATG
jgi:DNA-binding IclR family transcriptional regulator